MRVGRLLSIVEICHQRHTEITGPGAAPAPVNSHEVDTDKVDISDTIDDAETKYIDISGPGSGIHRIIQYLYCVQNFRISTK